MNQNLDIFFSIISWWQNVTKKKTFFEPFTFKFWVLGELESANLLFCVGFLWSSLGTWHWNSFKFPTFLDLMNSDFTSFITDNFPDHSMIMQYKISDFNIPISLRCFIQFVWSFRICFFYTYCTHWTQRMKCLNFGSFHL